MHGRKMFVLMAASILAAGCASCDRTEPASPTPKTATAQPPAPTAPPATPQAATTDTSMNSKPATPATKMNLSEAEWRKKLTPDQYYVLREKGTERAFTGKYWDTKEPGVYKCAACGVVLFTSDAKFDSGCGWPSFDKMIASGVIVEHKDTSHGMVRTEVTCANCGGHLGHVFDDGPTETHLRYCINSASIELEKKDEPKK